MPLKVIQDDEGSDDPFGQTPVVESGPSGAASVEPVSEQEDLFAACRRAFTEAMQAAETGDQVSEGGAPAGDVPDLEPGGVA